MPITEQRSVTACEILWMVKSVIPWWSGMPPVTVPSARAQILANTQLMLRRWEKGHQVKVGATSSQETMERKR